MSTPQTEAEIQEAALLARADELGCAPILVPVIERLNTIIELLTRTASKEHTDTMPSDVVSSKTHR